MKYSFYILSESKDPTEVDFTTHHEWFFKTDRNLCSSYFGFVKVDTFFVGINSIMFETIVTGTMASYEYKSDTWANAWVMHNSIVENIKQILKEF